MFAQKGANLWQRHPRTDPFYLLHIPPALRMHRHRHRHRGREGETDIKNQPPDAAVDKEISSFDRFPSWVSLTLGNKFPLFAFPRNGDRSHVLSTDLSILQWKWAGSLMTCLSASISLSSWHLLVVKVAFVALKSICRDHRKRTQSIDTALVGT